jgi:tetratricopeptide (TPR) repeat protein
MPFLCKDVSAFFGKWRELRRIVEKELVKQRDHVYIAMFGENLVQFADFQTVPVGVTRRAITLDRLDSSIPEETNPWPYYVFESMLSSFYRDYMNRSVTGYFFLKMGRDLWSIGRQSAAIQTLRRASSVAYNDENIGMELAIFYVDVAMYQKALSELKSASQFATDLSSLWNTWGYYYYRIGDIAEAIEAFRRSISAGSKYFAVYNNLGLSYLEIGKLQEARKAFKESLSINPDQPKLVNLMKSRGLQ